MKRFLEETSSYTDNVQGGCKNSLQSASFAVIVCLYEFISPWVCMFVFLRGV